MAELQDAELEPPRFAVDGLIVEGLNLFAGSPKVGKSWMVLNLALQVAAGGRVLGDIKTDAGEVLCLFLEDTPWRIQNRLLKMFPDKKWPTNCTIYHDWPKLADGGYTALDEWLTEHPGARMVIIDTLGRVRPPHKSNSNAYDEDYSLSALLQNLAKKHSIAVVAVHHTRKATADDIFDQISGSLGLNGGADALLLLKRPRNDTKGTLSITGRDIDERELAVEWDQETGLWKSLGDAGVVKMTQEREDILAVLTKADYGLFPRDIAASLGKTQPAIRVALSRMAADWLVIRGQDGRYTAADLNILDGHTPLH